MLVLTMPTPLWHLARARIIQVLGRGNAVHEVELLRRLDASRTRGEQCPYHAGGVTSAADIGFVICWVCGEVETGR